MTSSYLKLSLFPLPCFPIYWASELDLQNLSISQPETSSTFNNEVDTWQGKVHVPDRFFRQVRSSSGKLAYVIFGIEESSGVYYNWCVKCQIITSIPDSLVQASSQPLSLVIPPKSKARQPRL